MLFAAPLSALHSCKQAPADLPKKEASFDLLIALGILAGSGQIQSEPLGQYAVVGELALDGTTRPAKGALSMAMAMENGVACPRLRTIPGPARIGGLRARPC